jgi:hypothetical protein
LNERGVDDSEIQQILRHANVATTTAYYILPNIERAKAGIKKSLVRSLRRSTGFAYNGRAGP